MIQVLGVANDLQFHCILSWHHLRLSLQLEYIKPASITKSSTMNYYLLNSQYPYSIPFHNTFSQLQHYYPYLGATYFPQYNYQTFPPSFESYDQSSPHICQQDSSAEATQQKKQPVKQKCKKNDKTNTLYKYEKCQYKRMKKRTTKEGGQQKENRNVYSNILRNFFRRVSDFERIEKIVSNIIQKHKLGIKAIQFCQYIKKLKIDHSKYIRIKNVRQFFSDQVNSEISLIFRVLFEYYTHDELLVQTLTSRKIGRWSVSHHLEGVRQLKDRLFNFF